MVSYDVCFIVIDLETTGFFAKKVKGKDAAISDNQIAQIAFVVLDYNMEILDQGVSFVQKYDNKFLSPATMKFTGIREEDMGKGMGADELYAELVTLFKTSHRGDHGKPILVGHNFVKFDMPFLEYIFSRKGDDIYEYIEDFVDDTMFLARKKWNPKDVKNYQLRSVCEKAGIKLVNAHEALADTEATAQLFRYFVLSARSESGVVMGEVKDHREVFQF